MLHSELGIVSSLPSLLFMYLTSIYLLGAFFSDISLNTIDTITIPSELCYYSLHFLVNFLKEVVVLVSSNQKHLKFLVALKS